MTIIVIKILIAQRNFVKLMRENHVACKNVQESSTEAKLLEKQALQNTFALHSLNQRHLIARLEGKFICKRSFSRQETLN